MNWTDYQKIQRAVGEKIQLYIQKNIDAEIFNEAWSEFTAADDSPEGVDFSADNPLFPIFMSWLIFNWEDDLDEDKTIAQKYLETNPVLDNLQLEYLHSTMNSNLTFWEILNVWPGEKVEVLNLFTNEKIIAYERSGTMSMHTGDLIFAKTSTIQKINLFEGIGPVIIPSKFKVDIIKLKHYLKGKFGKKINERYCTEIQWDVNDTYYQIYYHLMNPVMPTLTNTDGELLVPHKMFFEINSAEEAFHCLHGLCHTESSEEILSNATYSGNDLKSVDFPWLSKGTGKRPKAIVLAHINIEDTKLTVEVNSEERADKFQKTIKKLMPKGSYKFKNAVIENIEKKLEENPNRPKDSVQNQIPPELANEIMEKYCREHWESWPKTKLPALNNQTPLQAMKSKEGRELVEALISDFEIRYAKNPLPGMSAQLLKDLRNTLGL